MSDEPSSTKVWAQGAVGEERIGAHLEQARAQGIEVLHDRRVPRSRANIDHLVVAPNGVWVVDPKRYLGGRLERRERGGFRRADPRLFVGGRDQTKLVEQMQKQVALVEASLEGTTVGAIPVHGALCFVDAELALFAKPFRIQGIHVTWRKKLIAPMLAPLLLDEAARDAVTHHLALAFPPA